MTSKDKIKSHCKKDSTNLSDLKLSRDEVLLRTDLSVAEKSRLLSLISIREMNSRFTFEEDSIDSSGESDSSDSDAPAEIAPRKQEIARSDYGARSGQSHKVKAKLAEYYGDDSDSDDEILSEAPYASETHDDTTSHLLYSNSLKTASSEQLDGLGMCADDLP